jgi:hypothetical protein
MNRRIIGIATVLLLLITVGTVFAQASSTVDSWLNNARNKSNYALRLARSDYSSNLDEITQALSEVNDILLRVQNYVLNGKELTGNQEKMLLTINANLNEIQQRVR